MRLNLWIVVIVHLFQVWCNNSQLPVDHILAGSFETAMRVSFFMTWWTFKSRYIDRFFDVWSACYQHKAFVCRFSSLNYFSLFNFLSFFFSCFTIKLAWSSSNLTRTCSFKHTPGVELATRVFHLWTRSTVSCTGIGNLFLNTSCSCDLLCKLKFIFI